ncbi:unnamed protein product [Fraxinus pennsylvanica]|uniref:Uncharacterized protein n=1 Tax=Fraxinus pennsylvanica TaxID=56036 RepID=A0AAD1ZAC1_9LAMI|nr:unnamed protein product [Fraxinus pennsylvanica]
MIAVKVAGASDVLVVKAAITVCSLIIAGFLFYLFYRFSLARHHKKNKYESSFHKEDAPAFPCTEFIQQGGAIKGVIVDEGGLDDLNLRKVEGGDFLIILSKVEEPGHRGLRCGQRCGTDLLADMGEKMSVVVTM